MGRRALELLNTAKFQLIRDYSVFNVAFGVIQFVENSFSSRGTLSIDRHFRIFYCPEFVEKLDVETLKWILLHELLHITKQHFLDNISNYSKDLEINDDIVEILNYRISKESKSEKEILERVLNFFKNHFLLPETFNFPKNLSRYQYEELLKQEFKKYLDKFMEEHDLNKDEEEKNKNSEEKTGTFLSFDEFVRELIKQKLKDFIMLDHGSGASSDTPEWEQQVGDPKASLFEQLIFEEILKNIADHSDELAGHLPADLIRQAKEYFKPKINWSATLRRYLTSIKFIAGNSYSSFNRINRQFSSIKRYIKELGDYEIPGYFDRDVRLAIIVDTSGSIGDHELSLIFSELKGIIKSFNVKSPLIISCDVKPVITSFNEALSGKFYGGGGTELHNAFELISKQNETFDCVITLTDGFTSDWNFKKPWNVNYSIVCLTPNHIDKTSIPAWHKVIEIPEQFLKDEVSKKEEEYEVLHSMQKWGL